MLWDLGSAQAEQYFKCWNTCVKLVYDIPRSTFTYLVEGYFAAGQTSLRNQVLSRYSGFFRNLLQSPSREVRVLARIVSSDPRSTTCVNLRYLQKLTGLDQPQMYSSARVRLAPWEKIRLRSLDIHFGGTLTGRWLNIQIIFMLGLNWAKIIFTLRSENIQLTFRI